MDKTDMYVAAERRLIADLREVLARYEEHPNLTYFGVFGALETLKMDYYRHHIMPAPPVAEEDC